MKTYQAGIDVGSTTVKLVVLDENGQMIFGQYQRHLSHTQRALSDLLKQARAALGECALELRATGSGAINLAKALGIDLAQVDIAFLSHAHNDHCGGLEAFLKLNDRAKVYMQKAVWGQYYVVTPSKCAYIGMDAVLKNYEDRFVLCDGVQKLDEELTVFSAVPGRELWSGANDTLREKIGEDYPRDMFRHEQDLLVTENGKTALFAGCAHCGIVNILKSAEDVLGRASRTHSWTPWAKSCAATRSRTTSRATARARKPMKD